MAAKTTETTINLQPIQIRRIDVRIIGDTPLVVHAFDEKSRRQLLETHMHKAKQAKEAKDPIANFNRCRYLLEDGRDGFPSAGLKRAIANAFRYSDGMKKVEINGALHVSPGIPLIPIVSAGPTMREDLVRIGMGKPDVRHRPEYNPWSMEFTVVFNERAISAEQVVNLLNIAGFGIGLGEHRPEKGGQWGMFHVAAEGEV